MKVVAQRVTEASVVVGGNTVAEIGQGLLVLVGVAPNDSEADAVAVASKLADLRVFMDADDKMNLSVADIDGQMLIVSQFTLLANVRKGRRPSFVGAAQPDHAAPLVQRVAEAVAEKGIGVATGVFGAAMSVRLTNDGPVTIVLESDAGSIR